MQYIRSWIDEKDTEKRKRGKTENIMAVFFSMPKLGMNMTEGTIISWLVREGDQVEAGQPIVDVETDKAVNTIETPVSGVIASITKGEGETVPCTFVIAVITQPGEQLPDSIPEAIADGVRPKAEVEVTVEKEKVEGSLPGTEPRRISISPSAKLLAKELGVDISKIIYSGDRINRKDVEAAYEAMQAGEKSAGETLEPAALKIPMTLMRKRIAEHMSASARSVARVGLKLEANAAGLIAWREELRASGVPAGYSEIWVRLLSKALCEFPYMNARLAGEEIWEMTDVNIGVAVDVDGGLVVPVIHNAERKSMAQITQDLSEKIERARQGKSLVSDLEGGTFTITNLGALEIEEFLPIINLPECAILGIGAIVKKPVVANDDRIEIQPRITLTLAFDHRLVDGAPAARFLQRLKRLVENPAE
jgi:pyruvate dehydrogenase E2 component (dihydrolipoamide acetyltransferase)